VSTKYCPSYGKRAEAYITAGLEVNTLRSRHIESGAVRRSPHVSVFGNDRICAVVAARTAAEALGQIKVITPAPVRAHLVELRLDFLSSRSEIASLLRWVGRQHEMPILIATCRRRQAGGHFTGAAGDEIGVLKQAVEAGCRWCDVEIETAEKIGAGELKNALTPARLLISAHDFKRLPQNLPTLMRRLDAFDGDAIKIAAASRSLADVRRLLELVRGRLDVVAVPMGDGMPAARILALRQGSALAYAPVARSTAPGQIAFDEIEPVYRLRRRFGRSKAGVNPRTRLYGVIGDPIAHSLSPLMHNAAFAEGKDAIYVPFHVRDLADFIATIKPLQIAGFSVTLPHKELILPYLERCDPLAAEIGAVNTVVVRAGKLCGYNTDFTGVLRAIERRLPLASSSVLLIGAGGSARAAAFALARAGAAVSIWARRPGRARALARAVGGEAVDRREISRRSFDAIVNCTPVGMHPYGGSPLESRELNCRLVMDLIYRPLKTELMRRAESLGIETISGVEMFVAQGVAQWELWMGERAPEPVMRRVVLAALQKEERSIRRR
jgi:3-dehydroquinate dehydratase / shikimate dehydrogenase